MDSARNEPERHACHDAATGLLNLRGVGERLDTAVALARRIDLEVTLLLIDVAPRASEGGMELAPAPWRSVAAELTAAVRDHDLVARTGATEFAVVLQASTAAHAVAIAERLLVGLARAFSSADARPAPTVCVGVATFPHDAEDVAGLWRGASVALASARERSGGAVAYAADHG
jgi:diguanylate cyclase (GGDEF)-like protein